MRIANVLIFRAYIFSKLEIKFNLKSLDISHEHVSKFKCALVTELDNAICWLRN